MSGSRQQPKNLLEVLVSFVSGLLFSVGLAVGGMTQPGKVVAFLDVAGDWDPSLAFVMMGAIAVYFIANRLVQKRATPWVGVVFHLPTRRDIEPRLLAGAGLFGIGWGLAGYCPGPGLSSLGTGALNALVFVASMSLGMLLFEALQKLRTRHVQTATSESVHGRA